MFPVEIGRLLYIASDIDRLVHIANQNDPITRICQKLTINIQFCQLLTPKNCVLSNSKVKVKGLTINNHEKSEFCQKHRVNSCILSSADP